MIEDNSVLALIPARSGSKGIPDKNIKPLAGKPLMAYSIEAALGSRYVDKTVVSTDSVEYAQVGRAWGANVPFLRPAHLADDRAKTIDAVLHAIETLQSNGESFDIVVLLQPTSPLRTAADLDAALECFMSHSRKGLVSVSECQSSPILIRTMENGTLQNLLEMGSTVRRQDMPAYFQVNGAIYVNNVLELDSQTSLNDNPIGYEIPRAHAVDIDEPIDFTIAEVILGERN